MLLSPHPRIKSVPGLGGASLHPGLGWPPFLHHGCLYHAPLFSASRAITVPPPPPMLPPQLDFSPFPAGGLHFKIFDPPPSQDPFFFGGGGWISPSRAPFQFQVGGGSPAASQNGNSGVGRSGISWAAAAGINKACGIFIAELSTEGGNCYY